MPEIERNIVKTSEGMQLTTTLYGNDDEIIGEYGGFISAKYPRRFAPAKLWVRRNHRGRGYGEKLMQETVATGVALGVDRLVGHVESEHALRIRAKLFGESALHFYDDGVSIAGGMTVEAEAELPITYEQAIQSLQRASEYEDPEDRKIGFNVEVDLKNTDKLS